MDDESKTELIKSATQVVELAYTDAFQPFAKEAGKALGTVGKTVNIALTPLNAVVWGYEKIEDFVNQKVSEKLEKRNVASEDIITPDPDIAVPAIEALRYSKLKDEYANLLAASMDKNTANYVHPAFVEILKQITPDEARILEYLYHQKTPEAFLELKHYREIDKSERIQSCLYGPSNLRCEHRQEMTKYVNNLCRLGLLEVPVGKTLSDDEQYKKLTESQYVKDFLESANDEDNFSCGYEMKYMAMTELGLSFAKSCIDKISL